MVYSIVDRGDTSRLIQLARAALYVLWSSSVPCSSFSLSRFALCAVVGTVRINDAAGIRARELRIPRRRSTFALCAVVGTVRISDADGTRTGDLRIRIPLLRRRSTAR